MADQVNEVKQKSDIVSLVNERVKLSRAGRNFKALCPFHSERTPSFMVSPELQIFKCFGCGKSGDVYSFLAEYDGMDFPEALTYLAKRAGVKLEPVRKGKDYKKKERLLEVNHLASEYFHFLLKEHKSGERARKYLKKRGIQKRAIEGFKLGFAPDDWDSLIRYLCSKKDYKKSELLEVGLVVKGKSGVYDRFRDRVIFPLRDVRGNVVGFAGRMLPGKEGKGGKYINSPETRLYHKTNHLYGLYENKGEIKKKNEAVMVEGELDLISSWQAGVKQVVAVKGTALTKEQIELVRRYTRNIVLALDADSAGEAATKRGIALADKASLNINIALIKEGKDPDDIAQDNAKLWRKKVRQAISVYDFYLESVKKRYDLKTGSGKKQATEELIPVVSEISNAVEQAHYIKKTARLLEVSEDAVGDEIRRYQRKKHLEEKSGERIRSRAEVTKQGKGRRKILEEYWLSLILKGGKLALGSIEEFEPKYISSPAVRRILDHLVKVDFQKFEPGSFIDSLPAELKELAQMAFLQEGDRVEDDPDFLKEEIERTTQEIRRFWLRHRQGELSSQIKELEEKKQPGRSDEDKLRKLRKRFSDLSHKLSE